MSRPCPGPRAPAFASERLALRVRLGLFPDDPCFVSMHQMAGEVLVEQGGLEPWPVHDRLLRLLLDTARDTALPMSGAWSVWIPAGAP